MLLLKEEIQKSKLLIIQKLKLGQSEVTDNQQGGATIFCMKILRVLAVAIIPVLGGAQDKTAPSQTSQSVTVPFTIDHNRIVIDAEIAVPGGSGQRVAVWVDNGNPDLEMSRRLATLLQLNVSCDDRECSAAPPAAITVGGMAIPLTGVKEAHIPLKPVSGASVLAPGMHADINLPSSVLRSYDVLVDFPGRKFSIGAPGTIHFRGESVKAQIVKENGLIQILSQIEKKKYNLALDIGSCINFLDEEVFDKLATAHPDWPHMTGAVGSANMWGIAEEPRWKIMRVDRLQYGPLFLTDVAMVDTPKATMDFFQKRAGMPTAGLLGSQALLNYRVGIDYTHYLVYFEIGRTFKFPDFDVVGLTLRPEDDGQFSILGVPDFDGQPSVPAGASGVQAGDHLVAVDGIPVRGVTMGQIWSMLGGTPGQERRVTIERGGKQIVVTATVRHFLGELPEEGKKK
jgi:hypothetical protein